MYSYIASALNFSGDNLSFYELPEEHDFSNIYVMKRVNDKWQLDGLYCSNGNHIINTKGSIIRPILNSYK